MSSVEVNSSLAKLVDVDADRPATAIQEQDDEDIWGEPELDSSEASMAEEVILRVLKQHMPKIRVKKPAVLIPLGLKSLPF